MAICSMPKRPELFQKLDNRDFDYLNSEKSLTRKLFMMADMLSLTREEHYERERIVNDFFDILRPYYPECDIRVFGSSANGFGFSGCDLDLLFLPFPDYCNLNFKDEEGSGVMPTPKGILSGNVSRNTLYHLNEEMHLKFVYRLLQAVPRYFKRIIFIPAKCPILNIKFVFTPIDCDFSVSNRFVLYNTELLWVYGKLDPRVKPLVMFLRYWTKSIGFISKSLLSSYCLTLLVIFYLQNTNPAVLPSVKYLNEKAGYSRKIDGWETAICCDTEYINRNLYENPKSLGELLIEFFDFYWNFDFVQNIVSVYEGKPLPAKRVKEDSRYNRINDFPVTPFSVQDPLILNRNVSRNTSMKTPFKLSLMIAKDGLKKGLNLHQLFDPAFYQDAINSLFARTKSSLPSGTMFSTWQLTYEICNKLAITTDLKPWFEKITQSIQTIFQYGLLLECEVIDKANLNAEVTEPPKKKRKFRYIDIGDLQCIVSIQCIVNFPTMWRRNRSEVLEHLKKSGSNFEVEDSEVEIPNSLKTEYKISKELSKEEIKNVTKIPERESNLPYFTFTCDCFQYPESSKLPDIVISFAPLTNRKVYNGTKEFLKCFVNKHIKLMLEEV